MNFFLQWLVMHLLNNLFLHNVNMMYRFVLCNYQLVNLNQTHLFILFIEVSKVGFICYAHGRFVGNELFQQLCLIAELVTANPINSIH